MTLSRRRIVTVTSGAVLALGLVACGSDDDADDEGGDGTTSESSDVDDDASEEDVDDAEDTDDDTDDTDDVDEVEEVADSPNGGDAPSWAAPVVTPGDQITTIEGDNFEVAVYQVGVTPSPKDGMLVDPDDNQPVLAEGDDIVFVNYVVTNTSSETIPMSISLVDISPKYEDWPYLQGMDSITDFSLYEEMGVNNDAVDDRPEDGIYHLEPGQSVSYGDNFMYRTDAAVIFEARLTPVDEEGDLVSDERQEVTAEVTLS
ncbi:hypothetical protein [Phytoactinopolyspora limicola]|uniref:hypothetical protein n=1 Tax=Phytoactinopolyspora limicola TaxID=2715536 RepID=UPI00140DEEAA|nr:hypothetical protein [Phytoactinopolyspora limicola]